MFVSTHVRQYYTIGSFQFNGITYEAIVILFQNKPPKPSWADWVRAQIKKMGLIPAKEEDLRTFIKKFGHDYYLRPLIFIFAVSEYLSSTSRQRRYFCMSKDSGTSGPWRSGYGHIFSNLDPESFAYYLALRPVEK